MDDAAFADAMRAALVERIGPRRHGVWIDGQVAMRMAAPNRLRAVAASPLVRDWLVANVRREVESAASLIAGCEVTVEFEAAEPLRASSPIEGGLLAPEQSARQERPRRHVGSPNPDSHDPFKSVVMGDSNRAAVSIARRATLAGGVLALLHGGSGVGKTFLLRSASDAASRIDRRRRVLYLTASQFTSEFVEACRGGGLPSFRRKIQRIDLLLIDDVQFFVGKARTLEELQQTIDGLQAANKSVLLASDRPLAELRGLGPELSSRLAAGVTAEVEPPDAAMRHAILQGIAQQRGVAIPIGALRKIASGLCGGAWELSGALNRWVLEMEMHPEAEPGIVAARVVEKFNAQSQPAVKLTDIHQAVSAEFGVEPGDLLSTKRTKSATEPRMLAMWLARRFTRAAWSEIGDYFGNRSHSTVISAHRRIESLLARTGDSADPPPALADAVRRIEARLRAG